MVTSPHRPYLPVAGGKDPAPEEAGGKACWTVKTIATTVRHKPAGSILHEFNHFLHIFHLLGFSPRSGICPWPCRSLSLWWIPLFWQSCISISSFFFFFLMNYSFSVVICYCLMDATASQIPPRKPILVSSDSGLESFLTFWVSFYI